VTAMYVAVSGPPGSGKSTLARALAAEMGLPLVSKDTIKDALLDVFGAADVAESRRVGRAAIAAMLAVAVDARAAVLESVWRPDLSRDDLAGLPGPVVEIVCSCPADLAKRRYAARATTRRAGHFDGERLAEDLWAPGVTAPIGGPWPVLTVDTTTPVPVGPLAARIRLASGPPSC
jgi:predicted kinase